ncbi:MAG: hypothetical protein D6679_09405 [Candidatus Hydrogenedentota bacterium]|nr:MAG: hypothetical protein D6679_09405 [Candidatus Hydrogenedentota bacterium]
MNLPECGKPVPVEIVHANGSYHLLRGGERMRIQGAGGTKRLDLLKKFGGNAVRTWHLDDLPPVLSAAQHHSLAVAAGIWMEHKRHGFDYTNSSLVTEQREKIREAVRRFRNHPALLLWGAGNEVELDEERPEVWKAINDVAEMIHEEDPLHPVYTVIAEATPSKIEALQEFCPGIDLLGVNSYNDMENLGNRLVSLGWDRPFIVTEFGPAGYWEVETTEWGAEIEETSTEKAEHYRRAYEGTVVRHADLCLGSFAFFWGQKQERTSTWFSLFLPDGTRLEPTDTLKHLWTGTWPETRCPTILDIPKPITGRRFPPGSRQEAFLAAGHPEGEPFFIEAIVAAESRDKRSGGDPEEAPPVFPEAVKEISDDRIVFAVPENPGPYRLHITVRGPQDTAASANFPFWAGAKG